MKEAKVQELHDLFADLSPLFHQKYLGLLHIPDGIVPKCHKNQLRSLFIIERRGSMTATELGRCLGLQKGSLTTLLDSLIHLNLVCRIPDPSDRRKMWLSLTPEGKDYLVCKNRVHEQNFAKLFADIPLEEIEKNIDNLKAIITLLKRI